MIEIAPIFALSNQVLVWIAAKVLAHYDLDLILTKYYKERLDSQLKNKKTYINESNLTESTVLNIPNLSICLTWISTSKPSSTRPFFLFLISPLSPLSLPSALT